MIKITNKNLDYNLEGEVGRGDKANKLHFISIPKFARTFQAASENVRYRSLRESEGSHFQDLFS
jgi:hypothetical protein